MTLLGYDKWERFEGIINRAMISCEGYGQDAAEHFREVFPTSGKNPEGGRPSKNYELSRYASYLITPQELTEARPNQPGFFVVGNAVRTDDIILTAIFSAVVIACATYPLKVAQFLNYGRMTDQTRSAAPKFRIIGLVGIVWVALSVILTIVRH